MQSLRSLPIAAIGLVTLAGCAHHYSANRAAPPPPVYTSTTQPGLLPAGTRVVVRTDEAIDATSASRGQVYPAHVAREIVGGNGNVLVPAGSPAELTVMDVSQNGRIESGQIQLGLKSITINGRKYRTDTESVSAAGNRGLAANRRTGEYMGGGALLGTLPGPIAGGRKKSATGGAVAGGAAQALTEYRVRVPAESVLTFRLDQPVRLREYTS